MANRPIHYRGLREHIDALRALGELCEVDREVDWNLEIGAITRRICETGGPAVLFNRIKGIEPGFRVLGAPAAASARPDRPLARVATSIGLPPEASPHEIVDVVKCETVDLWVPASSEIVLEDHVSIDEVDAEGPMAEFPGYLFTQDRHKCPVFNVTAMTFRNDPILPVVSAGQPPEENHTCWGVAIAVDGGIGLISWIAPKA